MLHPKKGGRKEKNGLAVWHFCYFEPLFEILGGWEAPSCETCGSAVLTKAPKNNEVNRERNVFLPRKQADLLGICLIKTDRSSYLQIQRYLTIESTTHEPQITCTTTKLVSTAVNSCDTTFWSNRKTPRHEHAYASRSIMYNVHLSHSSMQSHRAFCTAPWNPFCDVRFEESLIKALKVKNVQANPQAPTGIPLACQLPPWTSALQKKFWRQFLMVLKASLLSTVWNSTATMIVPQLQK